MKKLIILALLAVVGLWFWLWASAAVSDEVIQEDQIYVFVQQGCPHCLAAENYLAGKYPTLNVQIRDIAKKENRALFFACGTKFGISKMRMGTPFFCMGAHYILGWDETSKKQFDEYVKEFLSK